jgi:hypothetical protein
MVTIVPVDQATAARCICVIRTTNWRSRAPGKDECGHFNADGYDSIAAAAAIRRIELVVPRTKTPRNLGDICASVSTVRKAKAYPTVKLKPNVCASPM